VWAAGTNTWQKLAQKGVWVNGCAEGLGESEDPRIEQLIGKANSQQVTLTHTQASNAGTYDLQIQLADDEIAKLKSDVLAKGEYFFYWKSATQFQAVFAALDSHNRQAFLNCAHACGAGKTWQTLKDTLGSDKNLYIYLNEESWKSQP
jgi:hydroxymethylbilane synthase